MSETLEQQTMTLGIAAAAVAAVLPTLALAFANIARIVA